MKNATVVLSVVFQLNREWMITALLQGFSNDISFLFFITENVLSSFHDYSKFKTLFLCSKL